MFSTFVSLIGFSSGLKDHRISAQQEALNVSNNFRQFIPGIKTMTKIYRQGAVGALLDIYEQAISDLKKVIEDIPDNALTIILDPQTADEN